jgi:hypothetical protein
MKIWDAVYRVSGGYVILTTNSGVHYLDGTTGHKDTGEREAGKQRSGEVATPPPLSYWDDDDLPTFPKYNAPPQVPVIKLEDKEKVCPLCEGRKVPKTIPSLTEPCTFCGDTGKVLVCRLCGGMYKRGNKCLVCDGQGLRMCPDCQGLGEQLIGVICKRCAGLGHLTKRGNTLK